MGFLIPRSGEIQGEVELFCVQAALLNNVTEKVKDIKHCLIHCSTNKVAKALRTVHPHLRPKEWVFLSPLLRQGPIWPAQYYDLSDALYAMGQAFRDLAAPTLIWVFQDEDDRNGIAGLLLLFLMWATHIYETEDFTNHLTKVLGLKMHS